jgi:hypothetical protein
MLPGEFADDVVSLGIPGQRTSPGGKVMGSREIEKRWQEITRSEVVETDQLENAQGTYP